MVLGLEVRGRCPARESPARASEDKRSGLLAITSSLSLSASVSKWEPHLSHPSRHHILIAKAQPDLLSSLAASTGMPQWF